MQCKIINYEESRQIQQVYNAEGILTDLIPIKNSERVFIDLELSNGSIVRTEVLYNDFKEKIIPILQ